jgi:hypothetical protein
MSLALREHEYTELHFRPRVVRRKRPRLAPVLFLGGLACGPASAVRGASEFVNCRTSSSAAK